jgi:hypothetical protein
MKQLEQTDQGFFRRISLKLKMYNIYDAYP